jgi:hypothetical protein
VVHAAGYKEFAAVLLIAALAFTALTMVGALQAAVGAADDNDPQTGGNKPDGPDDFA